MKRHIISLLILFFSGTASAQSIDDTVIYILTGLEDSEVTVPHSEQPHIFFNGVRNKENNSVIINGIRFREKVFDTIIKFHDIKDCNISGIIEYNYLPSSESGVFNFTLDMSKSRGVEIKKDGLTFIEGANHTCVNVSGDICKLVSHQGLPFLNFGEIDRVKKAYSYYRSNYCAGSAF